MSDEDKSSKGRRTRASSEVVFYAYPKYLLVWPLIAIGPLLWVCSAWLGMDSVAAHETMAWIYIYVLTLVVVAMGIDVERNHAIFWLVSFTAVVLLGMYLHEKEIFLYLNIYRFFERLNIQFDPRIGMVISVFMAVPYVLMFIWARLSHKWRITHNEFELHSFGRRDLSLARGAKTVRSSYPDWFELLVCLSGTLVVYDARGSKVLQRIENVPLLPFLRKKIDRILETTAVTDAALIDDIEEADDDDEGGPAPTEEEGGSSDVVGDHEKL